MHNGIIAFATILQILLLLRAKLVMQGEISVSNTRKLREAMLEQKISNQCINNQVLSIF